MFISRGIVKNLNALAIGQVCTFTVLTKFNALVRRIPSKQLSVR